MQIKRKSGFQVLRLLRKYRKVHARTLGIASHFGKIPPMPNNQINITVISVNPPKKRHVSLRIDDHLVNIPIDADLDALFRSHFVRQNPSQKQKTEYATIMRLMVAAYKKGREDGSKK